MKTIIKAVALWSLLSAQLVTAEVPVTVKDFVRAETDRYMMGHISRAGLGKFRHYRQVAPIDQQRVVRMNRDTLYSSAAFDLTTPVTITMPETGGRYQSLQLINQDHQVKLVSYRPGRIRLTQELTGSRFGYVIVRTLVDADDEADVRAANALQDQIVVVLDKAGSPDFPDWDQDSLTRLREAIKVLGETVSDNIGVYGDEKSTNPVLHMIGAAYGWGGLPAEHAVYFNQVPKNNDGLIWHSLTFTEMPVDAFWSISVYNGDGYFEANEYNAYVINDRNAVPNEDGSITIYFGGDPDLPNFLPISPGWNYTVRLYRPKRVVLDGSWTMPVAERTSD